jgi:hypothetical protein
VARLRQIIKDLLVATAGVILVTYVATIIFVVVYGVWHRWDAVFWSALMGVIAFAGWWFRPRKRENGK